MKSQVEDDSMVLTLLLRDTWRKSRLEQRLFRDIFLGLGDRQGELAHTHLIPSLLPFSHLPLLLPNCQARDDIIFLLGGASLTNGLQAVLAHMS